MGHLFLSIALFCGLVKGFCGKKTSAATASVAVFNFYTYVFASVGLTVFYLVCRHTAEKKANVRLTPMLTLYATVMAVSLFLHSFFKTLAAAELDAVRLYPLSQGGALILSSLMAAIFFREKMTARSVIGCILTFLGLLVIQML